MKSLRLSQATIAGIIFTSIIGTLLHFAYEWSGQNSIISFIAPVNESVFEHLKLLFTPVFVFTLLEGYLTEKAPANMYLARFFGVLAGLIFIPAVFYTYTAITGTSYPVIDISLFYISVLITFFISDRLEKKKLFSDYDSLGVGMFIVMLLLFAFFTGKFIK